MILQLWQSVHFICFDEFQQHLQEVLSKFQFRNSSEIEICTGPVSVHGIKKIYESFWNFLKYSISFYSLSWIPVKSLRYVKHFDKHCHVPFHPYQTKISFRSKKNACWKECTFGWKNDFLSFIHGGAQHLYRLKSHRNLCCKPLTITSGTFVEITQHWLK